MSETGGRTQISGLFAAAIVLALLAFGATLLQHVPEAALGGVLLFVALRIIRLKQIVTIFRQSFGEFLLIVATAAAIIVLPIEQGVAVGIALLAAARHLDHDAGAADRFDRVPGTTIWWPAKPEHRRANDIRTSRSSACRRRCRSSTPRISAPMC